MQHAFPNPQDDGSNEYIFKGVGGYHKQIDQRLVTLIIWGQESNKAPGPDGIGSAAIKSLWRWDPERIIALFRACTRMGVHPLNWKIARGAVIPKQGKDDYTMVKSYRVICLLSCLGKTLERIVADGISN
jgi:hypothetical protein